MKKNPSMLYRLTGGEFGRPPVDGAKSGCPDAPCACGGESSAGETATRREFLGWFGAGLAGFAAFLAGIPIVGSFFSTSAPAEQSWQPVGEIDEFTIDEVVKVEFAQEDAASWAGPATRNAAWLRRDGEEVFTAFSIHCTHVGCPVAWQAGASLFICPCHGGVFDREGDVVAGPPESPLVRHDVRLRDGRVEILARPVPVTGRARG